MTAEPQAMAPPPATSAAMIRTLGGIAMLSGLLVVLVYQATLPRITENKRRAVERALFQVLPGTVSHVDFRLRPDGLVRADQARGQGMPVYAGYDAAGRLKGIAAEAAAQGYQDTIRILYGYSPACECITGIRVLRSTETPGLGDKIAKDPDFLANFNALDARLDAAGTALRHAIVTVKHGTKTRPWQIDAISGATISSKAVGRMLNDGAQHLLPRLAPLLGGLKDKP